MGTLKHHLHRGQNHCLCGMHPESFAHSLLVSALFLKISSGFPRGILGQTNEILENRDVELFYIFVSYTFVFT